jgi:hypothetical protein
LERIFHQLRGRLDGLLTSRQQIVDGPPAPARPSAPLKARPGR